MEKALFKICYQILMLIASSRILIFALANNNWDYMFKLSKLDFMYVTSRDALLIGIGASMYFLIQLVKAVREAYAVAQASKRRKILRSLSQR